MKNALFLFDKFIKARETFRKRSEDNGFNSVIRLINLLSQFNCKHKNFCQFRRKLKIFLEKEAKDLSSTKVTLHDEMFLRTVNF